LIDCLIDREHQHMLEEKKKKKKKKKIYLPNESHIK